MAVPDALLAALGLDVFEPEGDTFRRLGPPPAWADGAFPEPADGTVDLRASAFLDSYLDAAARAWETGDPLDASVWTEAGADGVARTLEVTPRTVDGRRLVLIGPHRVEAEDAHRVLQTARDHALAADAERRRTAERETLLHCIVHDLSNPLAGLRGSLKLLGDDADGADAELVAIGLRSADRMQATIRSVLDAFAASVDPLLPTAEPSTTDLAAAAHRAVEAARPAARTAGVALVAEPVEPVAVVAEAERLERAVANLLANAVRHARSEVRIRITRDAEHATVSVHDDGAGVAPTLRPRLFRPLVQGATGGGAVGLGLHSVRLAAEAWGGEAGETPTEAGAHFWIRLRRA